MDRDRLAVHEAGHALFARCRGMRVTAMIIDDPDTGAATWTQFAKEPTLGDRIGLALAGMVAEEMLLGSHDSTLCKTDEQDAAVAAIRDGLEKGALDRASINGIDADTILSSGIPGVQEAKSLIERTKLNVKAVLSLHEDNLKRISEVLARKGDAGLMTRRLVAFSVSRRRLNISETALLRCVSQPGRDQTAGPSLRTKSWQTDASYCNDMCPDICDGQSLVRFEAVEQDGLWPNPELFV